MYYIKMNRSVGLDSVYILRRTMTVILSWNVIYLFSEKDVLSGGVPNNSAAGWAGWAIGGVSNLTTKVYNKATKKPTGIVIML